MTSETSLAYVGRQPIFDRNLEIHAFELLFRSGRENAANASDGNLATSRLLLSTFLDIGLDQIAGTHPVFINYTKEFLLAGCHLPPERVVLEILEDVVVDDAVVSACNELADQGYTIALDDFEYDESWDPLIERATIIKIDVQAMSRVEIAHHITKLRPLGLTLLAEKVETRGEYDYLCALGFDLFQGYFLSRPEIVSGERIPDNRMATLQLLSRLADPNVEVDEIEKLVTQDISLSYKLLRYMNSAALGLGREVKSIHQAVIYVGQTSLKRWATLIVMANMSDAPRAVIQTAMVRAKMCELLATAAQQKSPEVYFTIGLLSALDCILNRPMEEIIASLPLSEEVRDALLDRAGIHGAALSCVMAYERCEWDAVTFARLPEHEIRDAFAAAAQWGFQQAAA